MLRKKISILLTAAMLTGLMAGCGSAEKNPVESSMAGESTEKQIGEESAGDSGEQAEETDLSGQEPYTVRIVADGFGSEEACAEIGAAVSEITKAKFNTEVEIVRYDFATYVDKVQTELASGEKIDLLGGVSQIPIPSAASQGQVIALNELLESDGQDILADISDEDLASTSIDGQVYAVRNNKELGLGLGFACNTEMLESLGIDYSNIMTEADMEPILQAVKEKYPDVYPLASDSGSMGDYMYAIDWLGRDFGVLIDSFSDDTTVVNFFTSDEYYELCKRRHEWSQNGLIMPDASINTEQVTSLVGAGKAFVQLLKRNPA